MNLIDQVLSGLKKRGANALPGETAVRVDHAPKNRVKAALIGGAVLVLLSVVCAEAWMWWDSRPKISAPVSVAQAPAKPISTPQTALPPVAATSGVEISQAPPQPVALVAQEALPKESKPKESGQKDSGPKDIDQDMDVAALSPSPELEAAPPVRAKPPATAGRQKRSKAASLPAPVTGGGASGVEIGVVPVQNGGVDKQFKPLSVQQQADNEFRRANGLMQQGHIDEALAGYEAALQLDAGHEAARQAMAVLLLQKKRNADAERVLQDGLKHNIKHRGFAMLLARIQLERDASWSALLVLQKTLPYAERQADYRAFVAALLQRLNRHKEAVAHYRAAVQLAPDSGVWWMGLGISLQALQRNEEARAAFNRALASHTLNADLQAFVAQQLKEL